jgi:hypothetical protein
MSGRINVVQCRQCELFQIVGTLLPPRCLARRLNRRQQQRDQNPDDRDDNKQFDERETISRQQRITWARARVTGARRDVSHLAST